MNILRFFLLLALSTGLSVHAHLNVPAPEAPLPLVLKGATIHPVSGPVIPDGMLLVVGGKIQEVGRTVSIPAGARVVDVAGKQVYPGLISANSSLGLIEIDQARPTRDVQEVGSLNPNVRAEVALNPDSELIPIMRSNGILTALSVPQAQGLIGGTSALIRLDGWTAEDLVIRAPVGLHLDWPNLRINRSPQYPKSVEDQEKDLAKQLEKLDEFFAKARAYGLQKPSQRRGTDLRLESLQRVVRGEMPVFVNASDLKQIQSALTWAEKQNVKLVIVGGLDAWRVADRLKERKVPVVVTTVYGLPERRDDDFDAGYTLAQKLFIAGVSYCLATSGDLFANGQDRNLPYQAAMAAAHGLPKEEALKAITLYPAQILGAGTRLGSLESGKDATFILTDGDPLEVKTRVERAWIGGREIDLNNRQTKLYDKYRNKPRSGG